MKLRAENLIKTYKKRTVVKGWDWAYPTYELPLSQAKSKIKSVVIDPSGLMADVNQENNSYPVAK